MGRRRSSQRDRVNDEDQTVVTDLRRAFPRELARSRRFGQSVSVLVAATSNEVEERVVIAALDHHLRRYDIVGRLDGTVVVVAPDTGRDEAQSLLARLTDLGAPAASASGGQVALGVAVAPEDGDELDAVIRIAMDRSLTSFGGVT